MNVTKILATRKRSQADIKKRGLDEQLSTLEESKEVTGTLTKEEADKLTVEELEALEEVATETERKNAEIDETIKALKDEIDELKAEIEAYDKTIEAEEKEEPKKAERSELRMKGLRLRRKYSDESKIVDFLETVRERASSLSNTEILVPTEILPYLFEELEKTSTFYKEVTVHKTKSESRVVYPEGVGVAVWIEKCAKITQEVTLGFRGVDVAQYKLAGFSSICNADLEDIQSIESLVTKNLGRSMAQALDKAVLQGGGDAMGEPFGVEKALEGEVKTVTKDYILTLIKNISKVKGSDKKIFMTEETYNEFILPELLKQDVGIATWMSGIQKPTLNGLPILWLDADTFSGLGEVYYGSFKKYILIERSGIKIAKSTEAQFLEDHTLYKVVGRFGGNVIDEKYFGISNLLPTALQTRKVNHTT